MSNDVGNFIFSDTLTSQHVSGKYDGTPQDSLGDFVTFVCQEPSDVQQLQVRTSYLNNNYFLVDYFTLLKLRLKKITSTL